MCEPATLMAISTVATLAGGAMSAMGQMQQAQAQSQAQRYQAQVAANNAQIAQDMARDARKRGDVAAEDQQRKTAALLGRQQAVMGAANLDMTSGSPLDILGDTAQMGALDVLTIRNTYEREARGHEAQRMNFSAESELASFSARNARTAGTIGAFTTIAGSLGNAASGWANFNRTTPRLA